MATPFAAGSTSTQRQTEQDDANTFFYPPQPTCKENEELREGQCKNVPGFGFIAVVVVLVGCLFIVRLKKQN